MSKIYDTLKEAGTFFLCTTDGDQPKSRPLGLVFELDGKVVFGVGTFKDCYKQLEANPKVEIVAMIPGGPKWIRYTGKAVIETDPKYAEYALEISPGLKNIYNEETGNKMGCFHLEDATAVVINLMPALGCEDIME